MKYEEVVSGFMSLTDKEREEVVGLYFKEKEKTRERLSVRIGQIVRWDAGCLPEGKRWGFADRDEDNTPCLMVIEYLPGYGAFSQSGIFTETSGLEVTGRFVDGDLRAVIAREEKMCGRVGKTRKRGIGHEQI